MNMSQVCPEECSGTSMVSLAASRRRKGHSSHSHTHHSEHSHRRRRKAPSPPPSSPPSPSPTPPGSHSGRPDLGSCKNWASQLEVRSQGQCGDCWAFATVESLRVTFAAQHGENPGKLSTQFLVDCMEPGKVCWVDKKSGHHKSAFLTPGQETINGMKVSELSRNGCCGGTFYHALDFIKQQGGIPTQADYGDINPNSKVHGITYSGINPKKVYPCKSNVPKTVAITGREQLHTEDDMAKHVCDTGPISAGFETNSWSSTYKGGVLSGPGSCGGGGHAMLVLGLNKGDNAWIVQNSWGTDFGVALDGSTLASGLVHRDYLHETYCIHLVEQGCSMSVYDAILAIQKVMQFEMKGKWKPDGRTVADECPHSCAAQNEKGGYIYMEYGKDTCAITHDVFVATSTTRP